jgi:hypothetical protein
LGYQAGPLQSPLVTSAEDLHYCFTDLDLSKLLLEEGYELHAINYLESLDLVPVLFYARMSTTP